LSATAREGSEVQTRTNFGHAAQSRQKGLEALFDPSLLELAEDVGREALELIDAEDCPKEKTKLLLMPDQMMLQIHESIGHPLELDRILGDERNYAGSSFVNLSDFGKLKYGSPIMNVTFDPTVVDEFASYAFDDTGTPATREYLIRDGILQRGLGGRESQLRAGVPGTANMRACSWNRAPIDRMANINLEAGSGTLDDLVSGVENGILMRSNRSWSIDDYRNKFQFGCEYAREIKDGQLGRVLKNPNYRGVTVPFWNSLVAVGGTETLGSFGTPYCGKGEPNQAISVGHRSPACVFDQIEVFGGEE
jgi:predicted Zn-dependent protease